MNSLSRRDAEWNHNSSVDGGIGLKQEHDRDTVIPQVILVRSKGESMQMLLPK